jgi:hypothetical protein
MSIWSSSSYKREFVREFKSVRDLLVRDFRRQFKGFRRFIRKGFVVQHSSQQKRRCSWSSKGWSKSYAVTDCELLYLVVIVVDVPVNPIIKSRTHCISNSNPEYVTIFIPNDISISVAKKQLKIRRLFRWEERGQLTFVPLSTQSSWDDNVHTMLQTGIVPTLASQSHSSVFKFMLKDLNTDNITTLPFTFLPNHYSYIYSYFLLFIILLSISSLTELYSSE